MVTLEIKIKDPAPIPILMKMSRNIAVRVNFQMLVCELRDEPNLSTMTLCASHSKASAAVSL